MLPLWHLESSGHEEQQHLSVFSLTGFQMLIHILERVKANTSAVISLLSTH
jgi:hypothetical protein